MLGGLLAWANAVYFRPLPATSELAEHVGQGRLGLGPVPRAGDLAGVDVGGAPSPDGVPDDRQRLDQERERDGALDGVRDPVAGVAGADQVFPGRAGRLYRLPQRVPDDDAGDRGVRVEGESPRSYGLRESGARTRTRRPGADFKHPYHRHAAEATCTVTSCP